MIVIFMKEIVELLNRSNKTVSTMESCTGGCVANCITNVEGASNVFKFGAVTYSNEFKIKMGVSSDVIDKYSVYSMETSCQMSKCICEFTNSNYGIGITGKLNRCDDANMFGDDSTVYISIYNKDNNTFATDVVNVIYENRDENKKYVMERVIELLRGVL